MILFKFHNVYYNLYLIKIIVASAYAKETDDWKRGGEGKR